MGASRPAVPAVSTPAVPGGNTTGSTALTEIKRKAPAATEALQENHHQSPQPKEFKNMMTPTTPAGNCPSCTVPAGNTTLDATALLTEADRRDAALPTLLASRLTSASQNFPTPEGARVYCQSEGNVITVAVSEYDPKTRLSTTREFRAALVEVTR